MSEAKKDEVVDHYETYEEYLNVFISEEDMLYLGEEEIARYIPITSPSNPFLCAADFFLQLGSCKEAVR